MGETLARSTKRTADTTDTVPLGPPDSGGASPRRGLDRLLATLRGYTPDARRYTPDARRYLLYTFGVGLLTGFVQVLLNLYLVSVGYVESFIGNQETLIAVVSAGLSLGAGVLVDRVGTRPVLLLSVAFTIAGRFAQVAHPSTWVVLPSAALVGAGLACFWVSQNVVLAQVSRPEQRAGLFGLNWALLTGSNFVGSVAAGSLPGLLGGSLLGVGGESTQAYRYAIWIGVGTSLLLSVPLLRLRAGGERTDTEPPSGRWWQVEEPRRTLRPLIVVGASAVALGFTVPFANIFLDRTYGASDRSIGLTIGVFALTGVLGGLLSPYFRRRFGPVRAVVGLVLLSAPLTLIVGYAPGLGVASAALWARGVTSNAAWPIILASVIEAAPERQRGRVNALMNTSFELSLACAALPAGLLMQYVSYRLPYALAAAALVAGALAYGYTYRTSQVPVRQ